METPVTINDQEYMGCQLKHLRKTHGFKSQEKFAEHLGLSKDTIYNYERGNTAIPHDIIKRICTEFNVSADYFFFGHDLPLVIEKSISDFMFCIACGVFKFLAFKDNEPSIFPKI